MNTTTVVETEILALLAEKNPVVPMQWTEEEISAVVMTVEIVTVPHVVIGMYSLT